MSNKIYLVENISNTSETIAQKSISFLNPYSTDVSINRSNDDNINDPIVKRGNVNKNKRNISKSSFKSYMYNLPCLLVGDNDISKKKFQTKHSAKVMARVDDDSIFIEDSSKNDITSTRQVTSKDNIFSPSSLLPIYHKQLDQVKAQMVIKEQTMNITKHLEQVIVREVIDGSVIDEKSITEYVKPHHKIGIQKAIKTIHSETIITNIAGTGNLIDESYKCVLSNRKVNIKEIETLSHSIFLLDNKTPTKLKQKQIFLTTVSIQISN